VPAIRLSDLSAQEKRAVALADNRLSELGTWDPEMLSLELKELTADIGELTFDYTITGFDTAEIDQLLGGDPSFGKPDPADEIPAPADAGASMVKPGDLWVCGQHRLYCGDALDPASYRVLLRGDPADIVFTDPPYNVRVAGHVSRRTDAREFAMASGELTSEEFVDFLQTISGHIAANVANGAVVYICMDWRHLDELSAATRRYFGKPKNMIVWVKTNGGQGSFYRSQHEHIAVYVAGTAAPTNNFRLGERGRYRTNVWSYAGFNSFGRDRATALSVHPTMKPVALVADALRDCSKRGEIVLDPFGGSGTTMIAAERSGRSARLIEIDPIYCDVIIRRWQTLSGKTAVLSEPDEAWAEVEARRRPADGVRE
jgi:DNA modification methylase